MTKKNTFYLTPDKEEMVKYEVDVELNVTDVGTVDYLRSLLNNSSFSLTLGPAVNVTYIDITTGKNGVSAGLSTHGC
ncbi:adhesion G protein-coupled receptor F5-like protein [Lates japonicus]|uniref:Adhesion G protein-coupled receptor F5-like protein n=1 Tax=Lates japonicus TaxID=270547 RepID=A0AAD3N320_LATJO|nr:adhesion G protein-coupled receptor F5-like protein [Lates japonicus]